MHLFPVIASVEMTLQHSKVAAAWLVVALVTASRCCLKFADATSVGASAVAAVQGEGGVASLLHRGRQQQEQPPQRQMRREQRFSAAAAAAAAGQKQSEIVSQLVAAREVQEAAAGVEQLLQPPSSANGPALATQIMKLEAVESGLAAAEAKWKSLLQVAEEHDPYASMNGAASASSGAALKAESRWQELLNAEMKASSIKEDDVPNATSWLYVRQKARRPLQNSLSVVESDGAVRLDEASAGKAHHHASLIQEPIAPVAAMELGSSHAQAPPAAAVLAAGAEVSVLAASEASSHAALLRSAGSAVAGVVLAGLILAGGAVAIQKYGPRAAVGGRSLHENITSVPVAGAEGAEVWKTSKARQTYRNSVLQAQAKVTDSEDDSGHEAPVRRSENAGNNRQSASSNDQGGGGGGGSPPAPKQTYRDRMRERQDGQGPDSSS